MKKNSTILLMVVMMSLSFAFFKESNKNYLEQLSVNNSTIEKKGNRNSIDDTIKILTVGNFHGDEIDNNDENLDWFGLFIADGKTVIKRVKISISSIRDEIIDNEEEKTGKKVDIEDENKPIVLISGLEKIKIGDIQTVEFKRSFLFPGERISKEYLGVWTNFSAYGIVNPDEHFIKSYKLQVSSSKDQYTTKQIIAETPHFDDNQFEFIWAGDLDNDGSLDLLMDISHHYNMSKYALFLSSYAEKGEIMKRVAVFTTVGC